MDHPLHSFATVFGEAFQRELDARAVLLDQPDEQRAAGLSLRRKPRPGRPAERGCQPLRTA